MDVSTLFLSLSLSTAVVVLTFWVGLWAIGLAAHTVIHGIE